MDVHPILLMSAAISVIVAALYSLGWLIATIAYPLIGGAA